LKGGTALSNGKAIAEVPARVLAAQLDLKGAWERVLAKAGMPGVDGMAVSRFRRQAGEHLRALESRLAGDRYQPLPLRLVEVEKKPGGASRLLLVPAVVDRVAQSAVAHWLGSKWDRTFDPASFAYRPGRGVRDALRALANLRDHGYRWVLDADIRSFFDSIDHQVLFQKLELWLGKSPMIAWLRSWVEAAVWDGAEVTRLTLGVPQGSAISPLLSNYYLDDFDRRLRSAGLHFLRYADDFVVIARTPFDLAEAKEKVEKALSELRLTLSEEKTRTTTFDRWFRFLGAEIQGDSILLPFEKKRPERRPLRVVPVMPRAFLRAYREGHLAAARPFVWSPQSIQVEKPKKSADAQSRALARLAGCSAGTALDLLRRRTT
jgi:CRISPR-associated protein Cas1